MAMPKPEFRLEHMMFQTAKAVYDQVKGDFSKSLSVVDAKLKFVEENLTSSVASLLTQVFEKKLEEVSLRYEKTLKELNSAFSLLKKDFSEKFSTLQQDYEKKLLLLQASHELGITHLGEIIKALPVPKVQVDAPNISINVPEGAIEVKQLPSIVNIPEGAILIQQSTPVVHLPEKSINVHVEHPTTLQVSEKSFNIHLEQQAPHVQVTVPNGAIEVKQLPSQVSVNVPRTRTIKMINYNELGQPHIITEHQIEDS